jgi:phosphatidylserine/phosphatidylglycerophosphate/cardiolipin synthase-like enzyme
MFDPPGLLNDMNPAEKAEWSRLISGWLDEAQQGNPADNDGPRGQFFNPLTNPPAADKRVAVIAWNAFPRQVKRTALSERQRWRTADSSRDVQDEYCEWSVTRDPLTRKITRVTFTCEGPEYWQTLAHLNPGKVLALYQQFISPSVREEDLFVNGQYNPRNRFNSTTYGGAMHLIQQANSLRAEIELGAAATIRRMRNGQEIVDAQELILCSQYGESERNSDPFIGGQVNALARQGADITINNPIGLYLHEFNPVGWITPDGADAKTFWTYVRGEDGHRVRAVYEVPPERGYVVGDIKINGKAIEFGAQIVDFLTIKLEGLATRIGQSTVQPFAGCRGAVAPPAPPSDAAAPPRFPLLPRGAALLARLPEALRREAALAAAPPAAAPPALLAYPPLSPEHFKTVQVSGQIMAYASPDSTYAVTKKLLDSAQRSIIIGIYDFSADYMTELLKNAMRRAVAVSLMLDTDAPEERSLLTELSALGANCAKAPSSSAGNPLAYFGNAHEKIIVVDGEIVMIQSGNWSENSIPFNEGDGVPNAHFQKGNRDMGIAVHSRELATLFAELVARDMRLATGQPPDAAPPAVAAAPSPASEIFFEAAPPEAPTHVFPSLTVTPMAPVPVTPVVTPENFHDTAAQFLRSARHSVRIEQQYVRGGQAAVEVLLQAIAAARGEQPGLDIRLIVSPKFLVGANRVSFFQAMADFHLEFDANFRFLSSRHFVHCHNKLVVVDDEKVLLGSQNWSTTGLTSNREASLLVEHAGIAGYFAEIFDADWDMSEPTGAPPDALFAEAVENLAEAADFARGGIVISSTRDYADV